METVSMLLKFSKNKKKKIEMTLKPSPDKPYCAIRRRHCHIWWRPQCSGRHQHRQKHIQEGTDHWNIDLDPKNWLIKCVHWFIHDDKYCYWLIHWFIDLIISWLDDWSLLVLIDQNVNFAASQLPPLPLRHVQQLDEGHHSPCYPHHHHHHHLTIIFIINILINICLENSVEPAST